MKKYDNYKDSGIEWIGEIPEHWKAKRIKLFSPVKRGASPRPIDDPKYFDENGEYAWVRIADVTASDRYLTDTTQKLSELGASLSVKRDSGDFFLSIAGSVGKPMITKIKCCIHDGFVYFPKLTINPEFLYYIFQTGLPYLGLGKLGTQLNLNTETVGNIFIPIPSDEEIEIITNYLDHKTAQIDTLIAKKEQFISLLQEERTAVINQAVTKGLDPKVKMKDSGIEWLGEIPEHWQVTRLGFLSSKIGDGLHGTPNYVDNSDFKFINGNNIGDGQISIYEHTKCVSEEEYLSNKKELNENSILMSINGTIGNLGFYKGEKVMLGKSVAYINIIDFKTLNFTYKYLESESCKTYIDNQLSGSTIKNLSLYSINKIPIPFPNFDEQKEIVDYITITTNEINILITKTQQEIELLKEYKTALISEVVTGKVDVRDVVLN